MRRTSKVVPYSAVLEDEDALIMANPIIVEELPSPADREVDSSPPPSDEEEVLSCSRERRMFIVILIVAISIITYLLGVVLINVWVNANNRRVVALFGDSLIQIPSEQHYLSYHLAADLYYIKQHHQTEVFYFGHGGYKIADLRAVMHDKLFHRFDYSSAFTWRHAGPPDAVILYWDSDVNPGPHDGTTPLTNATLTAYVHNLHYVLEQLKSHCKVVIMGGPTLSGELPRGQNHLDAYLDHYVILNSQIAEALNVTYINTRDAYFDNLPDDWDQSSGYLTTDGEHPNRRGSTLLRTLFRKALLAADELW